MSILRHIKKFNPTPANVLKAVGAVILAVFVLVFVFGLLKMYFGPAAFNIGGGVGFSPLAPGPIKSLGVPGFVSRGAVDYEYEGGGVASFSRSPLPPIPYPGGNVGDDAEDFEVTEYYATIETRALDRDCTSISNLKSKEYVVFENSNEYDKGCNYTFKVLHENVMEVLGVLENLNPKEFTESTYTIKKLLEDFSTREEILIRKQEAIEETLRSAVSAYDDITALAVRTEDVETLAKIIESKLRIIERLTQENLNISNELDILNKAKAQQLDRLEYTYFHVNIYENKYVDLENLRDSWKAAIRNFVQDINFILQDMTVNLISLLLLLVQYAIYIVIAVFVAKYGWQLVRHIWNK
jgi:hypothetical protein